MPIFTHSTHQKRTYQHFFLPRLSIALFLLVTFWNSEAKGADTLEVFELGLSNFEGFAGYDGIGKNRNDREIGFECLVGFGLADRFSTYISGELATSDKFEYNSYGLNIGVFGTPVDLAHFDLDLIMQFLVSDSFSSTVALAPALELNFDLDPDMKSFGLFLTAALPIYGRSVSLNNTSGTEEEKTQITEGNEVAFDVKVGLGAYYSITSKHQLFFFLRYVVSSSTSS